MSLKEVLKAHLWRITEIYFNAKDNYSYCYYFHNPDTNEELDYLKKERNLIFIRHSLWRLTVIELAKLFSTKSNDKFNLLKLISKLKTKGYFGKLKLHQEKIAGWEHYIQSKSTVINNIITLRDKIYAHTDPKKDDYKSIEIYFTQIEELFELVERILIEIEFTAFKVEIFLQSPVFDRTNFKMVKILAEHYKR